MLTRSSIVAAVVSAAAVLLPGFSDAQLFTLTKDQMVAYTSQNPFERFADGRPKVPDGLIERARDLSAEYSNVARTAAYA